jgi:hypothetical protein
MGFADEGPSDYPIVQCDLADVLGAPGMPARAELARSLSTPRHRWSAMAGEDTLFCATSTVGASAFAPFEEQLAQPVGSERVQHTFRSGVCSQQTHQQTLGDSRWWERVFVRCHPPMAASCLAVPSPTCRDAIRGRPLDIRLPR